MIISLLNYLLISNALTLRKDKSILFSRIVMISLFLASFLTYNNLFVTSLDKGIGIYGGLFHVTPFTHTFNIFIFIISAIILVLTSFFPRKVFIEKLSNIKNMVFSNFVYNKTIISNKTGEQFRIIEYSLIIVFVLSGAVFLMSASDLISIFLSIELQSYGLYILSTLYRDSEQATSGGLTYFLLGGLSSCFILLGSALLYVNSGTTSLDGIYLVSSISDAGISQTLDVEYANVTSLYEPYYIHLSLIILSVGFLFKIAAAPFHFWSPDVYDAIPTVVTTFVAIIAKLSIFIFFLELVYYTALANDNSISFFSWTNCLLISSLFSLIVGSVLGLTQFRIKRLYAYSTINHVGFILLALTINSIESIQAYIFYILAYTVSNLNAFMILVAIGYSFYLYVHNESENDKALHLSAAKESSNPLRKRTEAISSDSEKNNSPIQFISQLKGYFNINPYLAISLGITLFSFVGVPPLIGFFAKQMVLSAALDNGYVFMTLVGILTSVVGAVYYLNIIKQIFFYKSDYILNPSLSNIELKGQLVSNRESDSSQSVVNLKKKEEVLAYGIKNIVLSSGLSISISILTLILLLFIYIPNEWFSIANILTLLLFKP